jgi:uncharacterized protein YjbI with pentapeptide repeats
VPPRARRRSVPDRPEQPPRFDPAPAELEPGAVWDGVEAGAGLTAAEVVADVDLRESRLEGVDLSGRSFPGLHVRDTVFVRCDLSGAVLDRAVLERVVFTGCRLTGLVLAGANLRDVVLDDCRADLLDLRMASARFLRAEDTGLRGADLHEFAGTDVALLGCDLTGADLDRASLAGAHLHGSVLDGVRGALSLRGARIGADQQVALGAALLDALGVQVTEAP